MKKLLLSIMLLINVFSINLFYGNNVESVNEIRIINEYDASLINSQNDFALHSSMNQKMNILTHIMTLVETVIKIQMRN